MKLLKPQNKKLNNRLKLEADEQVEEKEFEP